MPSSVLASRYTDEHENPRHYLAPPPLAWGGTAMSEQRWLYPPDYVSAETLAYRLDCSRSTIDAYVRLGLLPKPETIGNLQRWDFDLVESLHQGAKCRDA